LIAAPSLASDPTPKRIRYNRSLPSHSQRIADMVPPDVTTFDKSSAAFPGIDNRVLLAACSASPLPAAALARLAEQAQLQAAGGGLAFEPYDGLLAQLRAAAGEVLGADAGDISFQRNSTEAISLIAAGYPFARGDEVIGYVHEYPANHYPWRTLAENGVRLVELANARPPGVADCGSRPCALSLDELEQKITPRTRVVALSHVQFASGYALDVRALAALCHERGIDLVIDAAQSLGALPVEPLPGTAAIVASGWKWLLGPIGSGLMWSSPELREKLRHVMVGAESMQQGTDYLDHSWRPHSSAKRFEYATSSPALVAALAASIESIHLRYGVAAINTELRRLQDLLADRLDDALFTPLRFDAEHRSGILAVICRSREPEQVAAALRERGFITTVRGGYLRFAPHFFVTDEQVARLAETMNACGR
jgi:selenocysteine lyase/cysteine desulfurase